MKNVIALYILTLFLWIQLQPAQADEEASGTRVIRHEASGNLEVTTDLNCLGLKDIPAQVTPPDLFAALHKCLERQAYDNSAALFALASLYARFDEQRVADESARQATQVLQQQAFEDLAPDKRQHFMEVFKRLVEQGSEPLNELCRSVRKRGMPQYYPRYMVQHGIKAILKPEQENKGLIPDIDLEQIWDETLHSYLHCKVVE